MQAGEGGDVQFAFSWVYVRAGYPPSRWTAFRLGDRDREKCDLKRAQVRFYLVPRTKYQKFVHRSDTIFETTFLTRVRFYYDS